MHNIGWFSYLFDITVDDFSLGGSWGPDICAASQPENHPVLSGAVIFIHDWAEPLLLLVAALSVDSKALGPEEKRARHFRLPEWMTAEFTEFDYKRNRNAVRVTVCPSLWLTRCASSSFDHLDWKNVLVRSAIRPTRRGGATNAPSHKSQTKNCVCVILHPSRVRIYIISCIIYNNNHSYIYCRKIEVLRLARKI